MDTLTEIIEKLNELAIDTQYDLKQDWNEDKELTAIHLQMLLIAKANLEMIKQTTKTN
jgi:ATP-dependent protease HslVU (ClpYQ) peptidase subunit